MQNFRPSEEINSLLEDFRLMVNDCVRIGLEKNVTSMKKLCQACYQPLDTYDLPTYYRLTAISKAAGILRNHRREKLRNPSTKLPYAHKPVLTDCYGFRIFGRLLRLPYRRGEYLFVVLNDHTLRTIERHEVRSITLTPRKLSVCYGKLVQEVKPAGLIGIDRNLDNVTIATGEETRRFDLSEATRIKSVYREVKMHFTRNDARIQTRIFVKYGSLQRNKVDQVLHRTSKEIIRVAKKKRLGLVMEDLKGIRRMYRKGNGQGRDYCYRLNSWSFFELQRQIEYKARWEGIPVIYVPARGTSAKCAKCGSKTYPNADRTLYCPSCKTNVDRDVIGAMNVRAKGLLRFGSDGPPGEAMVEEPRPTEVILTVDGGKTTAEVSQR